MYVWIDALVTLRGGCQEEEGTATVRVALASLYVAYTRRGVFASHSTQKKSSH